MNIEYQGYCVIYVRGNTVKQLKFCADYPKAVEEFMVLALEHSMTFKSLPRTVQEGLIMRDSMLRVFDGTITLIPFIGEVKGELSWECHVK